MKKGFYSDKLNKFFTSEEEGLAEEAAFDREQAEKDKANKTKIDDAKAVEDAYDAMIEARKQADAMIAEAKDLVKKAEEAYQAKTQEYVKKYYTKSFTLEDLFDLLGL